MSNILRVTNRRQHHPLVTFEAGIPQPSTTYNPDGAGLRTVVATAWREAWRRSSDMLVREQLEEQLACFVRSNLSTFPELWKVESLQ